MRHGWIGCFGALFAAMAATTAPAPVPERPADDWLPPVPAAVAPTLPPNDHGAASGEFASLRAEIAGARAKIAWTPTQSPPASAATATLVYSIDPPGHWEVRDWQSTPMQRGPESWIAPLPVACLSVPVVYFIRYAGDGPTRTSPARVFQPLLAGLEEPSHPFTGFLDGFEQGIQGWSGGTGREPDGAISHTTNALSGIGALRLEIPRQRSSVAAGSVRVRGWMLWELSPTALRFSARAPHGHGRVRCSLVANARTAEVQVFPDARDHPVDRHWSRLEFPIADFGGLRLREVDWMTIQFLAAPGEDLLVDDVELVLP
jgi:hypothetical protein